MTIYHGNKTDIEIRNYLSTTDGLLLGQLIMNLEVSTENHKALKDWAMGLLSITHGIHIIEQPVECPGCHLALYDQAAIDGWCTDCNPEELDATGNAYTDAASKAFFSVPEHLEHVHDFTGPEEGPVQCVGCGEVRHTTRMRANCKHMNVYKNYDGVWMCLDCTGPVDCYEP